MTTSISNAPAPVLTQARLRRVRRDPAQKPATRVNERTLADRFSFLVLSVAIVLSTLAFGTVHSWSLALFQLGAALLVVLWAIDAWQRRVLRVSGNALQLSLLGIVIVGFVQLLPLSFQTGSSQGRSLSLDPYSTRLVVIKSLALLVYFAVALVYTDSPRRLRLLVQTITVFGFLLAIFGLTQSFSSPNKIYWFREPAQSLPFGPFINRHHFAGYMELALAVPLGLLFTGAVDRDKRVLYGFAVALMSIALVMTGSRGGIISLIAEIIFLAVTGFGGKRDITESSTTGNPARASLKRAAIALALIITLFAGVLLLGGEASLSRFAGTVNADDPTTGRAHFWNVTLRIIRDYPLLGSGLGSYGLVYTRYDDRNGLFRLEQAHNDYLQLISDAGAAGACLGLLFLIALFKMGFERLQTEDIFRRGVAAGALAGCFAVLVHSFFDFTLHTTSNALLFLVLAALATLNGRVERIASAKHRRKRGRSHSVKHLPIDSGLEEDHPGLVVTNPESA